MVSLEVACKMMTQIEWAAYICTISALGKAKKVTYLVVTYLLVFHGELHYLLSE